MTGETSYVLAESLWWDGRLQPGLALRVSSSGEAAPIPLSDIPEMSVMRKLPGTLLPGLVDAHVHSGLVDLGVVRAGGIAGVWDLGSVPSSVAALAERSNARSAAPASSGQSSAPSAASASSGQSSAPSAASASSGQSNAPSAPAASSGQSSVPSAPAVLAGQGRLPRIRYAGPFLTAPGGYPSDRAWAAPHSWREVSSAAEAAAAVDEARQHGATLIKMTAHAGGPMMRLFTMTAIVDAAHDLGLPVIVHAEGTGTVAMAYEAGADLLAHTPWTEPLDRGLVRACAERMRWISTLDIHGWGAQTPESVTAVGNLRRFLEYGGSVRYGTDLGNGPLIPGVNPREVRALQQAGLTPNDILLAMTGDDVTWIPGGLDLDPARFADVLATARVLDDTVRPR